MSAVQPSPGRDGDGGDGAVVPAVYEETHVHGVYEAIAPHFSATRHKPWPFVSSFLAAQPPGSVGLDVGCGNGKNMGVNRDVLVLGCDRSAALVALARDLWCSERYVRGRRQDTNEDEQRRRQPPLVGDGVISGADVAVADSLELPFRDGGADFVICIAVIHHLSTRARRVDAIRQLLRCVVRTKEIAGAEHQQQQHGGKILVYVWALEQSTSRRGWDEGGEQDLLVPWVMKTPQQKKKSGPKPRKQNNKKQKQKQKQEQKQIQQEEEQQEQEVQQQQEQGEPDKATGQGVEVEVEVEEGAGAVAGKGASEATGTSLRGGAAEKESGDNADGQQHTDKTFHRFYHLYRKGELEEDVAAAGGEVFSSGYERDNWWVIAG